MSVHSIHRVYHAVVYGNLREDEGFVERWIGRDPHDRKRWPCWRKTLPGRGMPIQAGMCRSGTAILPT